MEYCNSLSSAAEFARCGKLEDWVHAYLLSDGNNKPFSDGLKLAERTYLGPIKMPLSLFHRCCGPEPDMAYVVSAGGFECKVNALMDAMRAGADIPPLIVHYVDGNFELNDGNHRFEAYARLGLDACDVIVWITEKEEYAAFMDAYAAYFE